MNSREEGFLLLTSRLGAPQRRPLTVVQLRELERCVLRSQKPAQDREIMPDDLIQLGCSEETAHRVVSLLEDRLLLNSYMERGHTHGCVPLSRVTPGYPKKLRQCLGGEAPGCIWYKGDVSLLKRPAIALVGSRDLAADNAEFAKRIGELAAYNQYVLISGNARGADTLAQESCLRAGGDVICVVADQLCRKPFCEHMLYVSEEGYDLPFHAQRALSRNRLIHSMAMVTFVAQCANGTGGTWDGTSRNLRGGWSPVYCLPDGSSGTARLYQMGAKLVKMTELEKLFEEIACKFSHVHNDHSRKDKMIK